MSPKSLLRAPFATSTLEDLAHGAFQSVIPDTRKVKRARRVILCSGKVYYDLVAYQEKNGMKDVVIHRLEMMYPFPHETLAELLGKHPKAEVVWCQEEPKNMGPWPRLLHWFHEYLPDFKVRYVGRPESAAPSVGSSQIDRQQQARLVAEALSE
jgi:2-oxoglutarate dehydrogenase E1 component